MSDEMEVEYYAAKANAWFNTKLEYDKSLLVLSAGAIGLLVTLLTTVGVNSFALLFVFFAATISFVVCLVAVLAIFSRNAKHLEELIAGKRTNDPVLGFLDSLSICSFIIGIVLASVIGLATATTEVLKKEVIVSKEKETNQSKVPLLESFNGATNIAPQTTDTAKRVLTVPRMSPRQNRIREHQIHLVVPPQARHRILTAVAARRARPNHAITGSEKR